ERFFVFNNPVLQSFAVGLSQEPPGGDLSISVFDGSRPFDPLDAQCMGGGGSVARVSSAPPGEYLVVVDALFGQLPQPFELQVSCGPSVLTCAGVPDLACNTKTVGDTSTGTSQAFLYGSIDDVFNGPEKVYHLYNPVRQTVN